jgi:hypothetical protein
MVSTRHGVRVGDSVTLGVHMDQLHLFDKQSGASLTSATTRGGAAAAQPVAARSATATPGD